MGLNDYIDFTTGMVDGARAFTLARQIPLANNMHVSSAYFEVHRYSSKQNKIVIAGTIEQEISRDVRYANMGSRYDKVKGRIEIKKGRKAGPNFQLGDAVVALMRELARLQWEK
jgi:hypothetical protein